MDTLEIEARYQRLEFKRSHTQANQKKYQIERWSQLDKRQKRLCPYSVSVLQPI